MDSIVPLRTQISDRFPVASFAVRVPSRRYLEIACATDPRLFHRDHQAARSPKNFFSSRGRGLIPAAAGRETTYLLPSEQLQQFAGAPRLYYALATYGGPRGEDARFSIHPEALDRVPSIALSADFTGRSLDRTRVGAPPPDARYGGAHGSGLAWGGDDALAAQAAQGRPAAPARYDDGYGSALWDAPPSSPRPRAAAERGAGAYGDPRRRTRALEDELPAEEFEDGAALARAEADGEPDAPEPAPQPLGKRRFGDGVRKRALLVGINAYQHQNRLTGCVPDVNSMRAVLKDCYGFADRDITRLTDRAATRSAILSALRRLFSDCGAGDVIVFHYSGHGASVLHPSVPNRLVQGLCPVETPTRFTVSNLITDADLTSLLGRAAEGANITIILDSCFSGGMGEAVGVPDITIKCLPLPESLSEAQDVTIAPVGLCTATVDGEYVTGSGRISNARLVCERRPNTTTVPDAKATLFTAVDYSELAGDGATNGLYTGALVDVLRNGGGTLTNEEVQQRVVEAVAMLPGGQDANPMLRGAGNRMSHQFLWPYDSCLMPEAAGAEDGREVAALGMSSSVVYAGAQDAYGDPARRGGAPRAQLDVPAKLKIAGAVARAAAAGRGYGAVDFSGPGELGEDEGISLGLFDFTQRSGGLGALLSALRRRDPEGFSRSFGGEAEEILAVTCARTPEDRLAPVAGRQLWEEPWLSRFQAAASLPSMCPSQNEVAVTEYLDPHLEAASWLGLDTPRALAMLHDRCLRLGNGAGLGFVARAVGPVRTQADRLAALKALGHPDLRSFQRSANLPATGAFDPRTHAALSGAVRRLGARSPLPIPALPQMLDRIVQAARGTPAEARLSKLRTSRELTDDAVRAA